jgi:glucose dehydrogenase
MRRSVAASLVVAVALAIACKRGNAHHDPLPSHVTYAAATGRINAATIADDGQWTMDPKDYANTRFRALAQIDTSNVAGLQVAWTFSNGILRGQEAAPLVVNNTMYVVSPFPNHVTALDLMRAGGPVRWVYKPQVIQSARGVACCDLINRGAAFADGNVIFNTLDNQTIALDANSSAEVWKTTLGDIDAGESMTMAPLVVRDKVLVGHSGGEFGVHGWLQALDVRTGRTVRQASATGTDRDCLLHPDVKPFSPSDSGRDLGINTWPPEAWPGANVAVGLDRRDATAALGFANAMSDLPQFTNKGGTLYTFG